MNHKNRKCTGRHELELNQTQKKPSQTDISSNKLTDTSNQKKPFFSKNDNFATVLEHAQH